jgi:hypothetical protein
MSIEAMKQALDFLEWFAGDDHSIRPKHKAPEIAVALRQAIAEAEKQEPVAFRNIETGEFCTGGFLRKDWAKWQPLYAAPPKREWVGLTVDEIDKFMPYCNSDQDLSEFRTFAFEIEAKLKERNT